MRPTLHSGKPLGWAPRHLERTWIAFGEGGERLFLMPELKLVVAITAGNDLVAINGSHRPVCSAR